ncbi:MAG: flavodoxin, partial [Bacilli bacterium]
YPIWWGVAAWPVDTFVKSNDFTGKTVIPFCTSASSGLGQSGALLASESNGGNWLEGYRFTSRPTDDDIKKFTDSIK